MKRWMIDYATCLTRVRALIVAPLFVSAACLTGCSENGESTHDRASLRSRSWAQTRLPNTPPDVAFDSATHAMGQWFRVAEADRATGLIHAEPEEYEQEGGTGRIRDAAIGYRNRMRRLATLLVQEAGSGSIVRCRVSVQRLDTADHRVFQQNDEFGDVPNDTPIEREAGVSPQQDRVWTEMPRDRALERQILNLIRDRATDQAATG